MSGSKRHSNIAKTPEKEEPRLIGIGVSAPSSHHPPTARNVLCTGKNVRSPSCILVSKPDLRITKTAIFQAPSATPRVRARPRSCIAQPHNWTARNRRAVQAVVWSGQNRTAGSSALLHQHRPATIGAREMGESRSRACTHSGHRHHFVSADRASSVRKIKPVLHRSGHRHRFVSTTRRTLRVQGPLFCCPHSCSLSITCIVATFSLTVVSKTQYSWRESRSRACTRASQPPQQRQPMRRQKTPREPMRKARNPGQSQAGKNRRRL